MIRPCQRYLRILRTAVGSSGSKNFSWYTDESKATCNLMMASFKNLADSTPGLSVLAREEQGFIEAVSGRAFNSRGIPSDANDDRLPDAVLNATTVKAVQAVIKYCASSLFKVAVRSGGHSWDTSWLHGRGTVILDVGDMATLQVDTVNKTATCGPGVRDIISKLPDGLFFPCGHCNGVPLGGYLLGGGFGLGGAKYGMASMLVKSVEAVLASGEIIVANSSGKSDRDKALFNLLKGGYSGFPGVITSFTVQLFPTPVVLMGVFFFELKDWRRPLEALLDMQWKGEDDVANIESTLCFCHSPPPVAEATGIAQIAMANVMVWGDTEEEAHILFAKYTKDISDTMIPPKEPKVVTPEEVTKIIGQMYPPKARFAPHAFLGDESVCNMSYADVATLFEPIADMYLNSPPPPPSSTVIVPLHPGLQDKYDLAFGVLPSLLVLSLAVYQDEEMDDLMESKLKVSHQALLSDSRFKTEMAEGKVSMTGASACFTDDAFATVQKQIQMLDPKGVFAGFHGKM
jgi:hypothetical protein